MFSSLSDPEKARAEAEKQERAALRRRVSFYMFIAMVAIGLALAIYNVTHHV